MEEDRHAITIAIGIFMAITATTAVLLRFAARRVRKTPFLADDYTIVAALVLNMLSENLDFADCKIDLSTWAMHLQSHR